MMKMSNRTKVEELTTELRRLGEKKPLQPKILSRAKEIMRTLRTMGFTNSEVSELSQGGWSEVTIKQYTSGTTVADPSPKLDVMKRLTQLIEKGLTVDDVETTISMKANLDAKEVSFEGISSLLAEANRTKTSVQECSVHIRIFRTLG